MAKVFRTSVWQARLPEQWEAKEVDGEAQVVIRKAGGVGRLKIIATDDDPSIWDKRGELFHGQLYGKVGTSTFSDSFARWWTLLCGESTIYVFYNSAVCDCETERSEIDEIVYSLLPADKKV